MAEPNQRFAQPSTPESGSGRPETAPRQTSAPQTSRPTGDDRTSDDRTMGSHSGSRGGNGEAQKMTQQVRSAAGDAIKTAKTNTAAKIEEKKSTISRGLTNVAENVRNLGDGLSDSNQDDPVSRFAADYSGVAADKLDGVADYFNSHDLNAIYRDTESFARRNPAVMIGGALALGFLAARFFKSSSERNTDHNGGASTSSGRTADRRSQPRVNSAM